MAFFDLVLQTSSSLHPDGEPDDFISAHSGVIRCSHDEDDRTTTVGKVKAYRIHADLAAQAGESVFDVCDAHSQHLHEVYVALFDLRTDELKDEVRAQVDGADSDVLVLDYVLLAPKWRGLKLGLLAARKMIDLLGGGCALAVSWVYPLNPDAVEFAKVPRDWIPAHANKAEEKLARRKLRRHFRKLGFERVGRTRFDVLSLALQTPTLADLIRPQS